MIEFSPVCVIRHFFLIPLRWRIREILLYKKLSIYNISYHITLSFTLLSLRAIQCVSFNIANIEYAKKACDGVDLVLAETVTIQKIALNSCNLVQQHPVCLVAASCRSVIVYFALASRTGCGWCSTYQLERWQWCFGQFFRMISMGRTTEHSGKCVCSNHVSTKTSALHWASEKLMKRNFQVMHLIMWCSKPLCKSVA